MRLTHAILVSILMGWGQAEGLWAAEEAKNADPQTGQSFEVPYILTQTNHFVVRAIINGKGPFHLVVDTGAPGLFLATEAAKKAGIANDPKKYFSTMDDLKLEGGPTLKKLKIRVEDPFQLVGMNSLGLPGVKLDGLMGFSVLARYRITLDPTHKRMIWTRLDFNPKEAPGDIPSIKKEDMPAELQAMNLLGPAMKFAAMFVGKQPEIKRVPQGFGGFSIGAANDDPKKLIVTQVLADSASAKAGLMQSDVILECDEKSVDSVSGFLKIFEKKSAGQTLKLLVRRKDANKTITITLEEGF
ncbi:MAG: PDZ domain-containing protein [Planctomycetota bacterium]|nr:PDZ domain-containing protein [Planctomycetota bacterium]